MLFEGQKLGRMIAETSQDKPTRSFSAQRFFSITPFIYRQLHN